jgi:hypothetical protein
MTTAVMTKHARERCEEMKISTKVAKAIIRNAEVTYAAKCRDGNKAMIALWSGEPRYAVVFNPDQDTSPVVLTVIFNSPDYYERAGDTFITLPK